MTFRELLDEGRAVLEKACLPLPDLDTSLLLAAAAGISREKLFASLKDEVPAAAHGQYSEFIAKRSSGFPVSYILNKKEFYGEDFYVDERVLVPRPDTELLVDAAAEIIRAHPAEYRKIHDCCTGSGCIALILKKLFPDCDVTASDSSEEALAVFRINSVKILGSQLPSYCSDLFDKINFKFDIITANPPYITSDEYALMMEQSWPEPESALEAGEDGLNIIRKLVIQAVDFLNAEGYLLIEAGWKQHAAVSALLKAANYREVRILKDLAGNERISMAKRPLQE